MSGGLLSGGFVPGAYVLHPFKLNIMFGIDINIINQVGKKAVTV